MKLKWRVILVTSVGFVTLVFLSYMALLSPATDDSSSVFKARSGHLVMPRNLADKSSWTSSNFSSPEQQAMIADTPSGRRVSIEISRSNIS